jgi:hypothetical protein
MYVWLFVNLYYQFIIMSNLKENKTRDNNLFLNIVREKCPNCGKTEVFKKKQKFLELPVMKEDCEICHYHFDREPGYFLGAMYISYGLAVLQGILTFLFLYIFFPKIDTMLVVLFILAVLTTFSMKNYKLSRIIYIHIFPF